MRVRFFRDGGAMGKIRGNSSRLKDAKWVKSRRGGAAELAKLPDGSIALRNANDPDGAVLIYTREEVEAFLGGAKDGDFDHLLK